MRGYFETAQICLIGHVITSGIESFKRGNGIILSEMWEKNYNKVPGL